MPPAVALAVPAIAGAGASAAGGKKARKQAQNAADRQFQFQQQLFQTGQQAWQPAANYWQTLLKGDPNAVAQATGPFRDIIRGQGAANAQQIAATTPQGGEANRAQAQNQQDQYNQIARLSAGVQPQAATALGQLAGLPLQLSAPNVGSGLKFNTHQQEQQNANKGAIGQGVGQLGAGAKQSKQSGTSSAPSTGSDITAANPFG